MMTHRFISVVAISVMFAAASLAMGQTRSVRLETSKPAAERVDIKSTFTIDTSTEHWAVEDAKPSTIDFAGRKISFDDRQISKSANADGDEQWLYPVSWYGGYQDKQPDLKCVVVRFHAGQASQIMAELMPNRMSLPKKEFQPHPDGKSYYSDMAMARQDGYLYVKQAVSQGREDGNGGMWVDMLVVYRVVDPSQQKAANTTRVP